MVRLQKFIARAGICSRRRAEALIREGRVRVNGRVVDRMGIKIDPEKDLVEVSGRRVTSEPPEINIMLNKPAGYISSCRHSGRKVVVDLLDISVRVYPAGRLDRDSTGLLLLTNNGSLHYRLTHPSFDHEKEYEVETGRPVSDNELRSLSEGILLDGRRTRPAEVYRNGPSSFRIVLREGRNRQIRRMVKVLGNEVKTLHRIRMATLCLGSLGPGKWRYLTDREAEELKRFLGVYPSSGGESGG